MGLGFRVSRFGLWLGNGWTRSDGVLERRMGQEQKERKGVGRGIEGVTRMSGVNPWTPNLQFTA